MATGQWLKRGTLNFGLKNDVSAVLPGPIGNRDLVPDQLVVVTQEHFIGEP
jgi:hypothetical protein